MAGCVGGGSKMEIRLTGSEVQIESAVIELKKVFAVVSVSKLYQNRNSTEYRCYIKVEMPSDF